jgi:hypothetical protein
MTLNIPTVHGYTIWKINYKTMFGSERNVGLMSKKGWELGMVVTTVRHLQEPTASILRYR